MTEQYKCKSYYNDDNVLTDCTCSKCGKKIMASNEYWEKDKMDNKIEKGLERELDLLCYEMVVHRDESRAANVMEYVEQNYTPKTEKKEDKNKRWMPEEMENYYVVTSEGGIDKRTNMYINIAIDSYKIGNCFKTRKEVELYELRLESMANRWMPNRKNGNEEEFWYWSFTFDKPKFCEFDMPFKDRWFSDYCIGSLHKTEEDAQKWYDKYGKAFEVEGVE